MSNIPEVIRLETLLQDNHIKILKQDVRMLTAPGENYGSVMLAVDLSVEENNNKSGLLQLVAKTIPTNEFLFKLFNIQETFKKESAFYLNIIPAITKFENEYKTETSFADLFARCYGARNNLDGSDIVDANAVLLLENLKIQGYDTDDRLSGFDKEHTELILRDLAKFHAVPMAMRILKPDEFNKNIMSHLPNVVVGGEMNEESIEDVMSLALNVLAKNDKCTPYTDIIRESMIQCLTGPYRFNRESKPFTTLVHSDYWVNNTMILKNAYGKPIKNIIVDLQLILYNSLVYDILFFLYSSVNPSIMYDNLDYFLRYYYDSFISNLNEFNLDLSEYSWEAFNREIKEMARNEIGHLLIMFKPILTEKGTISDMQDIQEDSIYNAGTLSPDYENRVLNSTLSFINKGWLSEQ